MIHIGICDDEPSMQKHLKKLCDQIFLELELEYQCVLFNSGEEVIAYQGNHLLVLFLDIELNGMNGIEVFSQTDVAYRVIFVTCYEQYNSSKSFGMRMLTFMKKPIMYEEAKKWIQTALGEWSRNRLLSFYQDDVEIKIRLEDLIYLEKEKDKCRIHTCKDVIVVDGSIHDWDSCLKDMYIVRINKTMLLNLRWISHIEHNKIILMNSEILSLSRKYNDVEHLYREILVKQIRGRL